MPQSKILLDSNAYFRLAKSIHPLLDVCFGNENHCLYVLKELDNEFRRNKRLRTTFHWVDEDEYVQNRRKRLTLSKKDKRAISITVDILREYRTDNQLGVSSVDIQCLAYGYVLGVRVVTDDGDMIQLAKVFAIPTMTTLDLMRLMLDCGHIDMEKVRQIAAFWVYLSDKPGNFRKDYIRLFKEKPP